MSAALTKGAIECGDKNDEKKPLGIFGLLALAYVADTLTSLPLTFCYKFYTIFTFPQPIDPMRASLVTQLLLFSGVVEIFVTLLYLLVALFVGKLVLQRKFTVWHFIGLIAVAFGYSYTRLLLFWAFRNVTQVRDALPEVVSKAFQLEFQIDNYVEYINGIAVNIDQVV